MAQHDYNLINQSGADFRADLNNALSAIATNNSGATQPSTTFAYEWWIDTATGVLKLRNSDNTAWITMPMSISTDNAVDINAGTINGITSLSFGSGSTVSSILDEDNLASNSATALATQQSIKAYVDSQVTAQDLDISDGSSTIAIDLDSETLSLLGGTGVTSTATGNGVTFAIGQSVGTSDNVVFNQVTGALVGNASTATALATARTISGVSFDGTANITLDTDDIGEGSNKYFTAERVDDQVNTLLTAGTGITLTYNDGAGTLTIDGQTGDITSVVAGNGLTGGGTSGDVTLAVGVDDSSIEINSDALRVKASGITNAMLAGSIANSKLANSSVTINSQAIALGGSHTFDTDDIGEGSSNLYYTDARANSAIDARVTNTFINNLSGVVADTATALATGRTIALSGDVTATGVSFDGTGNISLSTTIAANSVALGTDTTGNYVQTITGTANKISVSGSGSESADITLTLPSDVQIANDLTVAGNLTVNGTLTSLDTTNLDIEDNLFQLNAGLTGSPVNDSGMLINRGNQNNAIFMWDESNDKFALGLTTADGTSTGNITLTSTGTLVSNLEGNVTGTLQTAAQPNITSLGTLTTLTVDDITINGSTISDSGDFTLDVGGNISLDSDSGVIRFFDASTEYGRILKNGDNFQIESQVDDGDIVFKGQDGTSLITALTLDMSDAGTAIFNHDVKVGSGGILMSDTLNNRANSANIIYRTGSTTVVGNNATALVVADSGTVSFGTGIDVTGVITTDGLTTSADINFGDDDKALFGAGNDLKIYHSANNQSYIHEVNADGSLFILGTHIYLQNSAGQDALNLINGNAFIKSGGATKLQTTSTGIDVTGTATMDGLTLDGANGKIYLPQTPNTFNWIGDSIEQTGIVIIPTNDDATEEIRLAVNNKKRLSINYLGDISFYEDTGTTQALFWDASTERLGIGTTSPTSPLTVKSNSTSSQDAGFTLQANGSTNAIFKVGEKADGKARFHMFDGTTEKIAFYADGTANHISAGNLGIGTASPSYRLDVFEATGNGVRIKAGDATDDVALSVGSAGTADKFVVKAGGSVGIGTSSPSTALEVAGSAAVLTITDTRDTSFSVGDTMSSLAFDSDDTSGSSGSASHPRATINLVAENTFGSSTGLAFTTKSDTSNAPVEAMRIDALGRVGIGTDSPSAKLAIQTGGDEGIRVYRTTVNANFGAIEFRNSDDTATNSRIGWNNNELRLEATSTYRVVTNSSDALLINSSGNVGIGTSSPSTALDIHSSSATIIVRDTTSAATGVGGAISFQGFTSGTGSPNNFGKIKGTKAAGNVGGELTFSTSATNGTLTDRMIIDESGRLGVGTSSPQTDLHVDSGDAGVLLLSRTSANTSGDLGILRFGNTDFDSNLAEILAIQDGSQTNAALTFKTQSTGAATAERMRIDSNGTVLVGKTAEGTATDGIELNRQDVIVATRNGDAPLILNRRTSDGDIALFRKDNTTVGSISAYSSAIQVGQGNVFLKFANATDTITPANGNGTNNDNAIDLGSSGARFKNLYLSGGVYANNASGAFLWNAENAHIVFGTNNTERMRIDSSGKVGIGDSSPSYTLHVNSGTSNVVARFQSTDSVAAIQLKDNNGEAEIGNVGNAIGFFPAGAEKMRIASDGKVSIGTTSTTAPLRVKVATDANFAVQNTNSTVQLQGINDAANAFATIDIAGNPIKFSANGSESMRIDSSGNLLVGTTDSTPNGLSIAGAIVAVNDGSRYALSLATSTSSQSTAAVFSNTTGLVGSITTTGSATAYNTSSDARLKDVTGKAKGLEIINKLNPVAYNWKADGKADEGLIAQEVMEIVPNAVSGSEEEMYQMDYSKLVTPLIKAIQEQQTQIDALQSEINELKNS